MSKAEKRTKNNPIGPKIAQNKHKKLISISQDIKRSST